MKYQVCDEDSLDKFAMDQILKLVRKELEDYGDIQDACLCLISGNPGRPPAFYYLHEDWTPSYYERVSALARFRQSRKVLSVSDTWIDASLQIIQSPPTCSDRQKAIVIKLILPDGSMEWTITQCYTREGRQFTWDEPEKTDGGCQSLVPAWGPLKNETNPA
jgi:hypothetical protein